MFTTSNKNGEVIYRDKLTYLNDKENVTNFNLSSLTDFEKEIVVNKISRFVSIFF